jgi:hypothetical protein
LATGQPPTDGTADAATDAGAADELLTAGRGDAATPENIVDDVMARVVPAVHCNIQGHDEP